MTKAQQILSNNNVTVEKEMKKHFKSNAESLMPKFLEYLEMCNTDAILERSNISADLKFIIAAFSKSISRECIEKSNMMIYGKEKVSLKEKMQFHSNI